MAYSAVMQDLIDKLRSQTMMTLQDSGSDYLQKQVLTDDEFADCIESALDDFNIWPPAMTEYTVDTLIGENASYKNLLLLGGMIYTLIALEFYEAGVHFSVSDDGHSITRDRFANYKAIKDQLYTRYEKYLDLRKKHYAMSSMKIRGQFSPLAAVPYFAAKGNRAIHGSLYGLRRKNMR